MFQKFHNGIISKCCQYKYYNEIPYRAFVSLCTLSHCVLLSLTVSIWVMLNRLIYFRLGSIGLCKISCSLSIAWFPLTFEGGYSSGFSYSRQKASTAVICYTYLNCKYNQPVHYKRKTAQLYSLNLQLQSEDIPHLSCGICQMLAFLLQDYSCKKAVVFRHP